MLNNLMAVFSDGKWLGKKGKEMGEGLSSKDGQHQVNIRISSMDKYFIVYHGLDEAGYKNQATYLKITWLGETEYAGYLNNILRDYCYRKWGFQTVYINNTPNLSWKMGEISEGEYQQVIDLLSSIIKKYL